MEILQVDDHVRLIILVFRLIKQLPQNLKTWSKSKEYHSEYKTPDTFWSYTVPSSIFLPL